MEIRGVKNRRHLLLLFVTIGCLLVGLHAATSPSSADVSQSQTTVDGITMPASPEIENQALEFLETNPVISASETPDDAFILHEENQSYIVVTDRNIGVGEATVVGTKIDYERRGLIVASSVEHTTRGERVPTQQFLEDPDQYSDELIRVDLSNYTQVAAAGSILEGTVTGKVSAGTNYDGPGFSSLPPGRSAVETLNTSIRMASNSSFINLYTLAGGAVRKSGISEEAGPFYLGVFHHAYWARGPATVDIAVGNYGSTNLFLANVSFESQSVESIQSIQSGQYDGQVVTVPGDSFEAKISTKEVLVNALPCGQGDLFTIGNGCLPAIADVSIHTGVLYEGESPSREQMLPYVGLSNEIIDSPVVTSHRNLKVTGRVIDSGRLDPQLSGQRALLVYEVNYVNHNQNSAPAPVRSYSQNMQSEMRSQIVSAAESNDSVNTATPTAGGSGGQLSPSAGEGEKETHTVGNQENRGSDPEARSESILTSQPVTIAVLSLGLVSSSIFGGMLGFVSVGTVMNWGLNRRKYIGGAILLALLSVANLFFGHLPLDLAVGTFSLGAIISIAVLLTADLAYRYYK